MIGDDLSDDAFMNEYYNPVPIASENGMDEPFDRTQSYQSFLEIEPLGVLETEQYYQNIDYHKYEEAEQINSSPAINIPRNEILEIIKLPAHTSPYVDNIEKIGEKINSPRKRPNFPSETRRILNDWLSEHKDNPYPSSIELEKLRKITDLTSKQIRIYFTNNRSRFLMRNPKNGKLPRTLEIEKEIP